MTKLNFSEYSNLFFDNMNKKILFESERSSVAGNNEQKLGGKRFRTDTGKTSLKIG